MLQSLRNMQGEVRDEDTLGLAGLQGLPHTHHDQVVQDHHFFIRGQTIAQVGEIFERYCKHLSRTVSSTSSWNCLWGNELKRVKEPRCTIGRTNFLENRFEKYHTFPF